MYEEVKEKVDENYFNGPTKECIDMLGTLEARNDRSSAACEVHNVATKNKKSDHSEGADASSKSIPRVPSKNCKTNPGKGRQQNNPRHRGTQH